MGVVFAGHHRLVRIRIVADERLHTGGADVEKRHGSGSGGWQRHRRRVFRHRHHVGPLLDLAAFADRQMQCGPATTEEVPTIGRELHELHTEHRSTFQSLVRYRPTVEFLARFQIDRRDRRLVGHVYVRGG